MTRGTIAVGAVLVLACTATAADPGMDAGAGRDGGGDATTRDGGAPDGGAAIDGGTAAGLEVRAFGVQGFLLTYGGESVMTAPLFTRQSTLDVSLNLPIRPDVTGIDAALASSELSTVRAIVSGHAHYDHLLDVVHVMDALTPSAVLYANRSAGHIFAALAPDRDPACTSAPAPEVIDRARVIAVDDPGASRVDYTNCLDQLPPGAPTEGTWTHVPGSRVSLVPVCTTHPSQIGPIHFGAGSVDADLCDLPRAASGWLEGQTISFLIDFLAADGSVAFRVYYQDAPATSPIGQVPAALLDGHRVDLAILCVGSNDSVTNQPTDIILNLDPRFVLSGHWEDFFQARDQPIRPIPLLNVDQYVARAEAALAAPPDAPLVVDGAPIAGRHVLVTPGSRFSVPPPP